MWSVEYLPAAVEERAALPPDMRARLARMSDVIEENGLSSLPRDWVKSLGDKLWELRITGKDGIARAIYVTATGQRVVIVRIFVKKRQKTPQRELELAQRRCTELDRRAKALDHLWKLLDEKRAALDRRLRAPLQKQIKH